MTVDSAWRCAFSSRLATALASKRREPRTCAPDTAATSNETDDRGRSRSTSARTTSSRSSGTRSSLRSIACCSASRSSTSDSMRSSSSSAALSAEPGSTSRPCAASTSSCARIAAIGLFNSCEASATKRSWRSCAPSRRSSMAFIVRARRPISSRLDGSSIRRDRSPLWIAATSDRMRSTGCNARPVTSQVTAATSISSGGQANSSAPRSAAEELPTSSRLAPTITVWTPSAATAARETRTNGSSSMGSRASRRWTSISPADLVAASGGSDETFALAATTLPCGSRIWMNASSARRTDRVEGRAPPSRSAATSSARSRVAFSTFEVRSRRWSSMVTRLAAASATATTAVAASGVLPLQEDDGRAEVGAETQRRVVAVPGRELESPWAERTPQQRSRDRA